MKKILITLSIIVSLIVGCSNSTISFSGEGEYWDGEFTSKKLEGEPQGEFMFGFKNANDDIKFKELEIIINDSTIYKEEDFNRALLSISSSSTFKENAPINVTIKWNGKEDTFKLNPQQ